MIFKPEMFQEVLEVKADKQWLMEYVAKTANTVLREHLLTATVVYCDKDELHFSGVDEIGYTHKGYLIGVNEYYTHKTRCQLCGCELVADWKVK